MDRKRLELRGPKRKPRIESYVNRSKFRNGNPLHKSNWQNCKAPRIQIIRENSLSETTFTCRQTRVFKKKLFHSVSLNAVFIIHY